MKKIVGFLVFLLVLCSPLVLFCQVPLKIGTDDWAPYEYYQDGQKGNPITGYSTDLIKVVLNKMGVKFNEIMIYPWARGENLVFKGDLDVLYSASPSEKRQQYCYYPDEPLIESPWVFFIRKADEGRLKFDSFKDLINKRIGVVRAYAYTPEFWDFLKEQQNYQEVTNDEQNFKKLILKRLDYTVAELGNGISIIKKLKAYDKIVPLKGNPIKVTGLYVLFSKKTVSQKWVDEFSIQLKQFKTTDDYRQIYNKYF